ncbi:MAG: OsmC family protein [Vulcanimicrobiaceae bacterium]
MPSRHATAHWDGDLKTGSGRVAVDSGAVDAQYSAGSRFESAKGTNPEELLGASHAGCFTMMLTALLTGAGKPPTTIDTKATVTIDAIPGGFKITQIVLDTTAAIAGMSDDEFQKVAEEAKAKCPVSVALSAVPTTLKATLAK